MMREGAANLRNRLHSHLGPVLLWSLLCALFFLTLLIGRQRLPSSDFSGQFHAFGLFQAEELSQGRLPLWSPGSYGGFPFAADTQAAAFYPLRWLAIGLSLPWGFSFYVLELEAVFHIWLAGLFTYGLAYHMVRNRTAALVSATAFGLGGYLTSFPLLQLAVLETIIWLPLALLLVRQGVCTEKNGPAGGAIKYLIGAGVILGISFLAGHPQTFLHIAYLAAAYYFFLTWRKGWRWRWIFGVGIIIGVSVVGTAAVSWLPAAHLAIYTTRSDVTYEFVSSGLPMLDYLQLLAPGTLSFWIPEYGGLLTLVLAVLAWWGRGLAGERRPEILFWMGAAVFAAWLALGDAGVLFRLVYRIAPGFSLFRQQERLLGLVSLALALLAGQGVALWFQLDVPVRRKLLQKIAGAVALVFGVSAVIFFLGSHFADPAWPLILLRQGTILVVVFLLLWSSRQQRRLMLFLVLLLGLDLYAATYEGIDRQAGSPQVYWPEPAWFQDLQAQLAEEPLSRIDSRNLFHANLGQIFGLEDMHGISPLKLSWLEDFERLPQARRMELMGVNYILAYEQPETPVTLVGEIDEGLIPERPIRANIYEVEAALPRAWMSYQLQLVENEEAAWTTLADPAFDAAAAVVLHTVVSQIETITQPDMPPMVAGRRLSAAGLEFTVDTAAPGLLVISEWRYPGWQASLDGERVDLYPADYALQAVFVPPGLHTVRIEFRPFDVFAGGILSILTLVTAGAVVFGRRPAIFGLSIPYDRKPIQLPALPAIKDRVSLRPLARSTLWLLIPFFLLAFGLRIHNLGVQELRGDEAFSYLFATMPLAEMVKTLANFADVHTPLHYLLLHFGIKLFGDSEFAMRYLSLIPAVLSMPLLFILGRRLGGRGVGVLFVSFMAVSQSLVWLGQDVRNQYTLAVLFLTLATILLMKAVERPSRGRWLAYSLVCMPVLYSHYYALPALLAHCFYLFIVPRRRHLLGRWLAAFSGGLLFFLPWIWITLIGLSGNLSHPNAPSLARFLVRVGKEITVGPAFDHPLGVWIFLAAGATAVTGWRSLRFKQPGWAAMLGGWVFLVTVGIFLVFIRRTIFNAFYISIAAPAWWLLISLGINSLWKDSNRWKQWLALCWSVVLVGMSIFSLGHYYSDPYVYGRSSGLRPLTEHIAEQWQSGDVVVANFPDSSISYYLRDVPVQLVLQPETHGAASQETEFNLLGLSSEYDRLWFISGSQLTWDPENIAFKRIDYHTLIGQALTFEERTLFAFRPIHAVGLVMEPVGASLNDTLRLAGYYATLNGRPLDAAEMIEFQAGDELSVTLIWDCLGPVPENYTVFVHLLREDGSLIAQHDGVPLFGTRATTTWEVGERLLDRHVIEIPEGMGVGNGRLTTGMYVVDESGAVVRQVFEGGEDVIWLR